MSLRARLAIVLFAAVVAGAMGGCDRELRKLSKPASGGPLPAAGARQGEIQPGQPGEGIVSTSAARTYDGENAWELSQGKRLFRWYNCSGCHAQGGGGMGPALMDDRWIYGADPDTIYQTIMNGRPNGMPAFHGRIPEEQAWQLVAYVRSMSGLAPKSAAPGRSDGISASPAEAQRDKEQPRTTGPTPPVRTQ
ncbi:MAG TPA: c-type cytochrome [Usitatibacter sp.]|nr:c-type cytochrome [Usitatibacter sp.]